MSQEVFQPPEELPPEPFTESVKHVLGPGPLFRLYLVYCLGQVGLGAMVVLIGLVVSASTLDLLSLPYALPPPTDLRWLALFMMPLGLLTIAVFQLPLVLRRSMIGYWAGFFFLGLGLLNPVMLVPAILLLRHWIRAVNRPVLTGRF